MVKKRLVVKYVIIIFILVYIVSTAYASYSSITWSSTDLSSLLYHTGRFAGLLGFLCLSGLIFSGETSRYFDRFFGMDRIIKFQRKFSLFTVIVVLLHPGFFILSDISMASFLLPDFSAIPITMGTLGLYIMIAVQLASHYYKLISYRVWQIIHIITYALFFMIFYHASSGTAYQSYLSIRVLYWSMFIAVIIGIIFRTRYKIRERQSNRFFVEKIADENEESFNLYLRPEKGFDFRAGQFGFIRLDKNKLYARHPFTIASAPEDHLLRFIIQIKGRFTRTARRLKKGEMVKVDGPFGKFTVDDKERDLVFVAGGVGITPFISMIKHRLKKGSKQKITLLYFCRTLKQIVDKEFFDSIKEKWFSRVYVLDKDDDRPKDCEQGRMCDDILDRHTIHMEDPIFYICGPEPMKDATISLLLKRGVKKKDIRVEDFFW